MLQIQESINESDKKMKTIAIVLISVVLLSFALIGCAKKEDVQKMEEIQKEKKVSDLGIQANLVFFYYQDLEAAQRFYEDVIGLEMVLDYGFARLFRITQTFYIGLVDEKKGMHSSDEPKTVTLSFVTEEIDEW